MKLKKRVWLIFALLAAAYLLTNVVWKHYGKDERIVYRHSADPVTTYAEPTFDILRSADAVVQAKVVYEGWIEESHSSAFTVWVEDVWFGKCHQKLLEVNVYGVPIGKGPAMGDRMVLFLHYIEEMDAWYTTYQSHGMYILNPPFGRLHSLSPDEDFIAYDGKSPGTLKRDLRRILREKAADWPEEYTGDVVKKYLWWR